MGILDHVDLDSIPPTERWWCQDCGRNGFTMNRPGAVRRVEACPDCGGRLHVWPGMEDEPDELRRRQAAPQVPLALQLLSEQEAKQEPTEPPHSE